MKKQKYQFIIIFLVAGFGLGWLAGLSISPIISIIISSLTGVTTAIIAGLSGLASNSVDEKERDNNERRVPISRQQVNPLPIVCFIIGLCLGANTGIYARTNAWFGTSNDKIIEEWTNRGFKYDVVALRLFNREYPADNAITRESDLLPVLFTTSGSECQNILNDKADESLINDMKSSTIKIFEDLANDEELSKNPEFLKKVVEILCAKKVK
jgi:hypothetical protein